MRWRAFPLRSPLPPPMAWFDPSEFLCRCKRLDCSAPVKIDEGLLARLNNLRYRLDQPVIISSGLRCAFHNAVVGGDRDSEHLDGTGVDVRCETGAQRWEILSANWYGTRPLFTRIGIYPKHIHLGVSGTHTREVVWLT